MGSQKSQAVWNMRVDIPYPCLQGQPKANLTLGNPQGITQIPLGLRHFRCRGGL